jgi:hypothetical protein
MKKQNLTKRLRKPVYPMAGKAVLGAGILLAVVALAFLFQQQLLTPPLTKMPVPTFPPVSPKPTRPWVQDVFSNISPIPVDTSNWTTFTDRKYGYSVKLPPEYISIIPGKGATGSNPDPEGSGEMDFEDTQFNKPGDKYGFEIRTTANHATDDLNCTTDQECYDNLLSINKNQDHLYALHTTIAGREVKGLAIEIVTRDPHIFPTVLEYFDFVENGKVFELSVYNTGTFNELKGKQNIIDTIASTLSFNQ